jgi:hypothetical protein
MCIGLRLFFKTKNVQIQLSNYRQETKTMANIDIFNLEPSGTELFNDAESFLADLDEQEDVVGGDWIKVGSFVSTVGNASIGNGTGIAISKDISGVGVKFKF